MPKKDSILFDIQKQQVSFDTEYVIDALQEVLFSSTNQKEFFLNSDVKSPLKERSYFNIYNRRYIGNKYKLLPWIFSIINNECSGTSFTDIFAGTGVVSVGASSYFNEIIVNDFLHSNFVIYKAFLGSGSWDPVKIKNIIHIYNSINADNIDENYFSVHFGGKYFSSTSARLIGYVREDIEHRRGDLTEKEYNILLSSLLYSADKIANTVGHYDAYFKKYPTKNIFYLYPIKPIETKNKVVIFREDANDLTRNVETDIVYIDPPYNSRQYSRFYHILETLVKWDKQQLYGVALKPQPENMSDYCRVNARNALQDLVENVKAKYIVLSYNNTYNSKSNSSRNKITLNDIEYILRRKGNTKVFQKNYRHFDAGNTHFQNHKEYLFVTQICNE